MKKEIKIGDKVLGATSYLHTAQVGIVVHNDMIDIDPLHGIIINTNERKNIKLENPKDYNALHDDTKKDLVFVSSFLTIKYSKKIDNKYFKFRKLLYTPIGKRYLPFELSYIDFFNGKTLIIRFKLIILKNIFKDLIYWFFDFIFLAIPDLFFGDLVQFIMLRYKKKFIKKEIKRLSKTRNISFLRYLDENSKKSYDKDITNLENKLKNIDKDKLEISRSMIAIIIAVTGLIISIFLKKSGSK